MNLASTDETNHGPAVTDQPTPERRSAPVVTPAMRWWLSWIQQGGIIRRTFGPPDAVNCRKTLSYAMADRLIDAGVTTWVPRRDERFNRTVYRMALTELGAAVESGTIVVPASRPKEDARPFGTNQLSCLRCLKRFGTWNDSGRSGWVLDTPSGTQRVLDGLVRRGLVETREEANGRYTMYTVYQLTAKGLQVTVDLDLDV